MNVCSQEAQAAIGFEVALKLDRYLKEARVHQSICVVSNCLFLIFCFCFCFLFSVVFVVFCLFAVQGCTLGAVNFPELQVERPSNVRSF